MQTAPEPLEVAEPAGCHQEMADHGSEDQVVVASVSLQPDCCAVSADSEGEAPAVLTTASAATILIEAVEVSDAVFDSGSPARSRWVQPPRHPPLYHLHSSLLI